MGKIIKKPFYKSHHSDDIIINKVLIKNSWFLISPPPVRVGGGGMGAYNLLCLIYLKPTINKLIYYHYLSAL